MAMSEMVAEWMQMAEPPRAERAAVRLLCVDTRGQVPRGVLDAAAAAGIDVIGVTASFDDALRQTFMGFPHIIVLPYVGDQVLAFMRAVDHMRSGDFSPYVVVVADDDHGAVLEECEGFYRVSVLPRARVSQQLLPHLLRIAGELVPDA
jgi:hypothetical protein